MDVYAVNNKIKKLLREARKKSRFYQEVTVSNFFVKLTWNSPFSTKVKYRSQKKYLTRSNSNHRGIWVSFTNKN